VRLCLDAPCYYTDLCNVRCYSCFATEFLYTDWNSSITTKIFYTLTFRLPPEVFIRRTKTSSLHPVFGTVSNRCDKKTVVRVTELVAALLTVHGSLSFLASESICLEFLYVLCWFQCCIAADSGPCYVAAVLRENAVKKLKDMIQPADPHNDIMWQSAFGSERIANHVHCMSENYCI